jgi:aminopeptidase N
MKQFFLILNAFLFFINYSSFAYSPGQSKLIPGQADWYGDYDIKFYKIDIDVNDTTTNIAGKVTIVSEVMANSLDTFKFELYTGLSLDSIRFNNQISIFQRKGDIVKVIVPQKLIKKQSITAEIFYKGTVKGSGFFSPLATQRDNFWKINITWTLSEPLGAKYWFPCKQDLPDKADSAWIFITVPNHCKAGSNGLLTGTTVVGNNKTRYEWKTRYPIAYYLLSFAVADYQDYSFYAKLNEKDSVLVQNYIYNRPNYLVTYQENINKTKDMLRNYSRKFGEYPFQKEKYGHCVAPMGGGMEHQTMTTLSSFDRSLVSHELAHQWFGDLVTCATWQDIWVNEGFASYSEYLDLEVLQSHESAADWIHSAHQSALNEISGTIYVPRKDSANDNRIFSYNLTYKKGASIIHMLRYELNNDSLFFSILKQYLKDFKDSVATGKDFINVVNRLSGSDYNWFLNQWYYGSGYPVFDITWKYQDNMLILISNQASSSAQGFFKTHFDVKLTSNQGDTTLRLFQTEPVHTFQIPVNKEISSVIFDPDEWLLKKVTLDKVPDSPSFDNYLEVLPNPFSTELNLKFKISPINDRFIKLINTTGDTILELSGKKKTEIKINTETVKPGTYLLYVIDGSKKYISKLVKVEQ